MLPSGDMAIAQTVRTAIVGPFTANNELKMCNAPPSNIATHTQKLTYRSIEETAHKDSPIFSVYPEILMY